MSLFTEIGVLPALERGLAADGITRPTAIQAAALPVLLSGQDAFISSETGTGKTLAYLLPLLERIDPDTTDLQAMVLAPTHELSMQIHRTAQELVRKAGLSLRVQPLIGLRKLKVHTIKAAVVDEMDRLLAGDNLAPTLALLQTLPRARQLVFVSATVRPESLAAAKRLAPELALVQVGGDRVSATIEHLSLLCEARDKPVMLRKLIHAQQPERAIVFVHTNARAEMLSSMLAHHKIAVADIHGTRDKLGRKKALDDLRSGKARVLIASDLAARGLDIKGVSHVYNIDVPSQSKDYLHRVGRTGRVGEKGVAVSLVTEQELGRIKRLERELGIDVTPVTLSRGKVLPAGPPERSA